MSQRRAMTTAVILAAGRGTRLGRYTRHLPKALVRVAGRSLLDWHLRCLADCGITSVVIVGGYRCAQLARRGIELIEAPHWSVSGPLASLVAARPARWTTDFLVLYADCPHHASNVRALLECRAEVAIVGDRDWRDLWQERHAEPLLDAETYRSDAGRVREIGAKPASLGEIDAQFAGLLRFSQSAWAAAERIAASSAPTPTDMTALLAAMLRAGHPIADVPIHGRWCEIDSADDLRLCRRRLHAARRWPHDWRDTADDA
jgi:choline kinase